MQVRFFLEGGFKILRFENFWYYYLAHVIEQPIFRILNILFVYFFIDFFVKHIFLRHV